jgi:hypothetical protein
MAHCGFEGTAVNDAFSNPLKLLWVTLRGPRTSGPMAPELPLRYDPSARYSPGNATVTAVPVAQVKRINRETEDSTAAPR